MTDEQKKIIDYYIESNKNNEDEFNLVLEKLNECLSSFLNEIILNSNNEIFFKLHLLGEHFLNSNFDYENPINILIEVIYANEENYNYSKAREQKLGVGKILTDAFNANKQQVYVENDLLNSLYKNFILKGDTFKAYKRKNCVYLKFLDYKFVLFFLTNNNSQNFNFTIKGSEYNLNLDETHKNLTEKNSQTNGKFFNLIKFYKIIEKELFLIDKLKFEPSRILYFYENLLYNVPNELLNNNYIYDNFIESYNFLLKSYLNNSLENFISSDNKTLINDNYKLFAKYYITTHDISRLLKQCKVFINNIDDILNNNKL